MNLNKIALVSGLVVSGITVSSFFSSANANTITQTVNIESTNNNSRYTFDSFDINQGILNNVTITQILQFSLPYTVSGDPAVPYTRVGTSQAQAFTYVFSSPNTVLTNYGISTYVPSNPYLRNPSAGTLSATNSNTNVVGTDSLTNYSTFGPGKVSFANSFRFNIDTTNTGQNMVNVNYGTPSSNISVILSYDYTVPEPLNILGATTGLVLFGSLSTAHCARHRKIKRRKLTK